MLKIVLVLPFIYLYRKVIVLARAFQIIFNQDFNTKSKKRMDSISRKKIYGVYENLSKILSTNCIIDENDEKEAGNGPSSKKYNDN